MPIKLFKRNSLVKRIQKVLTSILTSGSIKFEICKMINILPSRHKYLLKVRKITLEQRPDFEQVFAGWVKK